VVTGSDASATGSVAGAPFGPDEQAAREKDRSKGRSVRRR
jgi:hypothetical protein